ncbi:MAG TPA: alpha/beta hydrolase [Polyangiaceae bacterium]|nr:alpha/beta hydrolase [Polyangiaceae bacterium]
MQGWAPRALKVLGVLFLLVVAFIAIEWKSDIPLETLKARYATGTSRFVDVDGMSVHYRDEGTGPAVVLIHGTGSSLHTWDAWASALSTQYRVVRFDLPAFGLTGPRPDDDYRIETYVEWVDHVVSKLGVPRFALAGNSLGGEIAWRYAAAHPDHVGALVLVDAAGYPRVGTAPMVFRLGSVPLVAGVFAHLDPRRLVDQTVHHVYGDPTRVTADVVERYYELSLRPGNRAAFGARTSTPYVDRTALLGSLRMPTLILWGDKDALIPVANAQRFAAAIAGATVKTYADLGHVPMEEDGARTVADVRDYLTGLAPRDR